MTKINIGKGSSKFYCNLIKAYLKNHEKVSVVAGGLRINLGVWVCYYISKEFKVEKTNVHYWQGWISPPIAPTLEIVRRFCLVLMLWSLFGEQLSRFFSAFAAVDGT